MDTADGQLLRTKLQIAWKKFRKFGRNLLVPGRRLIIIVSCTRKSPSPRHRGRKINAIRTSQRALFTTARNSPTHKNENPLKYESETKRSGGIHLNFYGQLSATPFDFHRDVACWNYYTVSRPGEERFVKSRFCHPIRPRRTVSFFRRITSSPRFRRTLINLVAQHYVPFAGGPGSIEINPTFKSARSLSDESPGSVLLLYHTRVTICGNILRVSDYNNRRRRAVQL